MTGQKIAKYVGVLEKTLSHNVTNFEHQITSSMETRSLLARGQEEPEQEGKTKITT